MGGSGIINIPAEINENKLVFVFTDAFYLERAVDSEIHSHSFFEIHYFLEGSGCVTVDGEKMRFEPGKLLLIAPEKYHIQSMDSKNTAKYIFKFYLETVKNKNDDITLSLTERILSDGFVLAKDNQGILAVLREIEKELAEELKGYKDIVSSLLTVVMTKLCRECCGSSKTEKPDKLEVSAGTETIIDNYFDQNFNRGAKIEELCGLVHLSCSQLSRVIRSMYGMSYKEKQVETRLNYIQHLLKKDELTIEQISQMCGFESASGLSNFFKRHKLISPQQYRKQSRV